MKWVPKICRERLKPGETPFKLNPKTGHGELELDCGKKGLSLRIVADTAYSKVGGVGEMPETLSEHRYTIILQGDPAKMKRIIAAHGHASTLFPQAESLLVGSIQGSEPLFSEGVDRVIGSLKEMGVKPPAKQLRKALEADLHAYENEVESYSQWQAPFKTLAEFDCGNDISIVLKGGDFSAKSPGHLREVFVRGYPLFLKGKTPETLRKFAQDKGIDTNKIMPDGTLLLRRPIPGLSEEVSDALFYSLPPQMKEWGLSFPSEEIMAAMQRDIDAHSDRYMKPIEKIRSVNR